VAKATRNTVLKVRYLRLTLSMGSKGNPITALSTTERSHLGDAPFREKEIQEVEELG
jgi:hypothetical protein